MLSGSCLRFNLSSFKGTTNAIAEYHVDFCRQNLYSCRALSIPQSLDKEDAVAISSSGQLYLRLTHYTYQRLGLVGAKSKTDAGRLWCPRCKSLRLDNVIGTDSCSWFPPQFQYRMLAFEAIWLHASNHSIGSLNGLWIIEAGRTGCVM